MLRFGFGLALAGASVLALAACDRHPRHHRDGSDSAPMTAASRLDCPDTQGALTRKATAADGRSCDYDGPDGAVVALSLNAMTGKDADAVLDPLGHDLRAELPSTSPSGAAKAGSNKDDEKVDIDLPGVHIHAKGDRASVDAGPNDGKSGVHVNANDSGAEVHVDDRSNAGVRKLMILAADKPGPHGYTVAGYEAHGPANGPLVVATIRARDHGQGHDALMHDVDQLVKLNAGG
jgi:hypothetical protein